MYRLVKRLFDIGLSAVVLVVVAPLMLIIPVLIKCASPGPIFYKGLRVGRGGRQFGMFKYRTMVVNADQVGGASTADDDPRITRVGKMLRAFKLDELPQLINVLRGEMSFVGPRPEVQHYVDMFTKEERAILSVPPGITDWASLWNPHEGAILAGSADPERAYFERIRPTKIILQLAYVRHCSLWTDLRILGQTFSFVVFRVKPRVAGLRPEKGEILNETSD